MSYNKQKFEHLTEKSIIEIHLNASNPKQTKDFAIVSTLAITEKEVRHAMLFDKSKNILPIMGIIAIIEQLGTAYKRKDIAEYPDPNHSAFKKALYYFFDRQADDDFSKTLYGLRNGIVHNASFYSVAKGNNQISYNFIYDHIQTEIIVPAQTIWNGTFTQNISLDTFTSVNPALLLNMVKKCIISAETANKNGDLEIILTGGKHELIMRYLKWRPIGG